MSALERQVAVSQKQLTDAGIEIQVVASGGKLELVGEDAAVALDGGKDEGDNGVMTEYFATSTTKILMGRLPWLFVLLLIQSSAAAIMASFEQVTGAFMFMVYNSSWELDHVIRSCPPDAPVRPVCGRPAHTSQTRSSVQLCSTLFNSD